MKPDKREDDRRAKQLTWEERVAAGAATLRRVIEGEEPPAESTLSAEIDRAIEVSEHIEALIAQMIGFRVEIEVQLDRLDKLLIDWTGQRDVSA